MIDHPALLLEASSHNVRVLSWVTLLPSFHSKGNLSVGILSHLEKAAKISNLVNRLTFRLVYAMLHCLVANSTFWGLGSTYFIGLGW